MKKSICLLQNTILPILFLVFFVPDVFSQAEGINLPNSNTIWSLGQQNVQIQWETYGVGGTVTIQLYNNDQPIGSAITTNAQNNGSFIWNKVPTSLPVAPTYRIFIKPNISGYGWRKSEYFRIDKPTTLKPTVTTGSASSTDKTSVFLNGKINPNGAQTNYYFKYSTDSKTWIDYGGNSIPVSFNTVSIEPQYLSKLAPGTLYYFKLVATNSAGTTEGSVKSFQTLNETNSTAPIKSATIKWYKNNVVQTTSLNAGAQGTIYPDAGTKVDMLITKEGNVSSPATFYVSDFNNQSYSQQKSSSFTSETFYNCVGPLDTELWLTVNTNEGAIKVQVFWSKPSSPDLNVSNVALNGAVLSTGLTFPVGQTVNIQSIVWNMGKANAAASKLALFLRTAKDDVSGTPLKTNDVPSVNAGQGSDQMFSYTFAGSDVGDKYFVFKADHTDLVNEGTLENNNIFSFGPFKVSSPANISLSPSTQSIGNVNVNVCSAEKEYILKNNGSSAVSGAVYIDNSTHFGISEGGGGFSLAPGASKSIKVKFCPLSVGALNTTLKIVLNGTTTPTAQATITGTGVSVPETIIGYSGEFLFDTKKEMAKTGGIYLKIIETKGTNLIAKAGYEYKYYTEINDNEITTETISYNERVEKFIVSKDGNVFIGEPVLTENQDWDGSIKRLLFFDNQEKLIGHIIFEYSFLYENLQARQAIIFLHNENEICNPGDNTISFFPYHINSPSNGEINGEKLKYNYYEFGEYPVSMLIPPHVFDRGISRGFVIPDKFDKTPVLFVHGLTGSYSSVKGIADIKKTGTSGDQVSYWFDTVQKLNYKNNAGKYHAWQYYYPAEDDLAQCGIMLGNALKYLNDNYSSSLPVNIVAHSMGGPVTMDFLTRGVYNIKMIGKVLLSMPPIHGSLAAYLNYLTFQGRVIGQNPWIGKDGKAPAYRDLSIGSNFIYNLHKRTWVKEMVDNIFVLTGLTTKKYLYSKITDEAVDHSDGVVSYSSASLLEKGIGFAGIYGNHDDGKYSTGLSDRDFMVNFIDDFLTLDPVSFENSCLNDSSVEIFVDKNRNLKKPQDSGLFNVKSSYTDVNFQKGMVTLIADKPFGRYLYYDVNNDIYRLQYSVNVDPINSMGIFLGYFDENKHAGFSFNNRKHYNFTEYSITNPGGTGFPFPTEHNSFCRRLFYDDTSNFPQYFGLICRNNMEHQFISMDGLDTKSGEVADQETPVKELLRISPEKFNEKFIFVDDQTKLIEFFLHSEEAFKSGTNYAISLISPKGSVIDSTSSNISYSDNPYTLVKKIVIQSPLPGKYLVVPKVSPYVSISQCITKAKLASNIVAKSIIEGKNPALLAAEITVPDPSKMQTDSLSAYAIIMGETTPPDTIYLTTKQSSGNTFTLNKVHSKTNPGNYNYTMIVTGNYNDYRFERAVYGSFIVESNMAAISVPDVELTPANLTATLKMSNYFICNQCDPSTITYEVGIASSTFIDEDLELSYKPETANLYIGVSTLSIRANATMFVNCLIGENLLATDTFRISFTPTGIPVNLAATAITRNAALLTWNPKGEETKWEVKYGLAGFNPHTEGSLLSNVNEASYQLQGLQQGADYEFYVRAVFAENAKGGWSWPGSFSTNHVITVMALANGSANPAGETEVARKGSFTIGYTPNEGYHVSDVLVDGKSTGPSASYTFTNIDRNHTVIVTFAMNVYNISAGVYPPLSGSVNGTGQFLFGNNVTLNAQPAEGFKFLNWTENFAVAGNNPELNFTANRNRNLQANFTSITGINEIEAGGLLIYPNPARDVVTVLLKNQAHLEQVEIFNMVGQKILHQKSIRQIRFDFEVKDWPPGIYLIRLVTADGIASSKFIVAN